MKINIVRLLVWSLLLMIYQSGLAQIPVPCIGNANSSAPETDLDLLLDLPILAAPAGFSKRDLPPVHDNSSSPYLRPVFNQNSACCGQASGVSYNFTYEINRLRILSSADTLNQYPSHFTWNFMNDGNGYFGVSYFHSFEILKKVGNPTVPDWGGMDHDEGYEWMSGYDKYYRSMKNRLRSVSQIKVNKPDGLLTLKHWLHNHLEGSEHGGVANFYAASPWGFQFLPDDSPEAGKHVMTEFQGDAATHAMTIVGYHDSVCYDYNGDGQYTNHIDLNKDGLVDMRDWEIGALKFVNSYGDNWGDSGFCFMMYKTLADQLGEGGIWNHCVHVIDVKADYQPKLTFKFTIKHNSREKIKITAGLATDTAALIPDYILEFPIFDYQGGNNYMQGQQDNEVNKYLETGLDITPLLSHISPGQQAKFFLQITETDPLNEGTGRIIDLRLMDYNNALVEIPALQSDVPLAENGTRRIGIVHDPVFDKVEITTEELPRIQGGTYSAQINAQNGQQPYQWSLLHPYHQQQYDIAMPEIDDEELAPAQAGQHFAGKKIAFSFPFYGETFDTIYMHRNGYLMFAPDLYPWPYFNDAYLLFKKVKNIAGFYFNPVEYYNDPLRDAPQMWYEGNAFYAAFRWAGSLYYFDQMIGTGEFAVVLYPDGNIDYFYNDIQMDEEVLWYAGVSAGNEKDFTLLKPANAPTLPQVSSYRLLPEAVPATLAINDQGILSGQLSTTEHIYNLSLRVADDHAIADIREYSLSDGLTFDYTIQAGEDDLIQNEETFSIDLTVKNRFDEAFHNVMAYIPIEDPNLELIEENAAFATLLPGQSKTITDAFTLKVKPSCPNQYTFFENISLSSDEADWMGKLHFEAVSPTMRINSLTIFDDNNHRLDPGETVDFAINISNTGVLNIDDILVSLSINHPSITINNPQLPYGPMIAGEDKALMFSVSADPDIAVGEIVNFEVDVVFNGIYNIEASYSISVGQYTALVFRKGSSPASAEAIMEALEALGVAAEYTTTLPSEFELYRSVFVSLGGFLQNVALSQEEAAQLISYLNKGGRLYMEGTMTWTFDQQTSLHPLFKTGAQQISFANFENISGVSGTFTEGMDFVFSGQNAILPCLMHPVAPAYGIFYADADTGRIIATANPGANYKTLGMVNEFGTLGDESQSEEREVLMYKILEFFDLEEYVVQIEELEASDDLYANVQVFPNPFVDEINLDIQISQKCDIAFDIFDLTGRHIKNLKSGSADAGRYQFSWDGKDNHAQAVPPGIYIYQLRAGNISHSGKVIRVEER